ncbi:snRNA-activating protein complex subunit 4-like protein, partial [Bienertia sinuspersici]
MAEPSTSQNQNHTTTATTTSTPWGTLEELLLACAVHRYGTNSWDSIAKELQNRTTLPHFTPLICQQKFRDLKRRFADEEARNAGETDAIPCLDELRRLRVAELRRELQRYDLSIVSLQLKVKKLKEESENDNDNKIINNVINEKVEAEEEIKDDDEKLDLQKNEEKKEEEGGGEMVEEKKEEAEGDTWNSAESTRSNLKEQRVNSGEMVESVAESKEGVKESSDVQSTVNGNDGNKVKKVGVLSGNSSGEENQTQSLVEFLEVVRGRKLGSFFERRLLTQ